MNTDLSVAPEIAQLADPFVPKPPVTAVPRTDGRTAAALTELAATPQRWWDLVRFDPDGPARIPVPGEPGAGPGEPGVWLLVLPPGTAVDCDCQQATALAGEAAEAPGDPAPGPDAPGGRRGRPAGPAATWPRPGARRRRTAPPARRRPRLLGHAARRSEQLPFRISHKPIIQNVGVLRPSGTATATPPQPDCTGLSVFSARVRQALRGGFCPLGSAGAGSRVTLTEYR